MDLATATIHMLHNGVDHGAGEGHDMADMATSVASAATTAMSMAMGTATAAADAAATTAAQAMGGMGGMSHGGMGGADPNACKISMLWNWNTINACFIARSWHIKTKGMFAGSCIGIVCLCIAIELVRRFQREYDRYLLRRWLDKSGQLALANADGVVNPESTYSDGTPKSSAASVPVVNGQVTYPVGAWTVMMNDPIFPVLRSSPNAAFYTPSIFSQLVRATLYLFQYAGAYFVMLLAMYYNGYIIICIFIGGLLGNFLFGADTFKPVTTAGAGSGAINPQKTCCC